MNLVDDESLNECAMRVWDLGVLVRLSCEGDTEGDLDNGNGLGTESCSQRLAAVSLLAAEPEFEDTAEGDDFKKVN